MAERSDVWVVDLTNVHRRRDIILQNADVVVLNMVCDPDLLPMIEARSRRNLLTVYEVNDDVACMQPFNPAAGYFANPDHQILFRMLLRACQAVQFCTPELHRIYGKFASKSAVFPNQIQRSPSPVERATRSADGRTVVGWGGSFGHLQDIAEVAEPIIDWVNRRQDVVLHLMCAEKIWALFERLEPCKKRHTLAAGIEEYHDFIASLDIGLAPLENTGFNRCRSDVKFLEYALHGVVPVVSSLTPYERTVEHRKTGMLFRDSAEMLSILDELLDAPELRRTIATQATRYVTEQRQEFTHAAERIDFYRSLLPARRANEPLAVPAILDELTNLEGAEVRGRLITLDSTRYERLLHDALVLGQLNARKAEALELLREAEQLESSAYLPHLFSAAMSNCPVDCLKSAITRNPRSLSAHILLAESFAALGQVKAALTTLLSAAEVYPTYDMPYLRLAEFMLRLNQPEEAKRFFDAVGKIRRPYLEPSPSDS
jgi:tetratricopeptide (TPR) repeat protein